MKKTLYYILILVLVYSCKKDEIPIAKHKAGDVLTNSFEMGADYRYQAYYDLKTNKFISSNIKTSWDIGFENGTSGWHIILNNANFSSVSKVSTDFNTTTDTIGLNWSIDVTSGNLDSTAFGDWQTGNPVYVINKGVSYSGASLGLSKIELLSVNSTHYNFKIANLDGSQMQQISLEKDNNLSFTCFSVSSGKVNAIPPKENWDIMFTQYTHIFKEHNNMPYLVTGIISNRNNVLVAEDFDKEFSKITIDDVDSYNFSNSINTIGYDWKKLISGNYLVDNNKNYIIKSTEGEFYKLHFIDFYNSQGDKGTPTFEVQKL